MRYLTFLLSLLALASIVHAGPDDKWVYVGQPNSLDGIALLLAIGAFAWVYVIYHDFRGKKRPKRR